MISNPIPKYLVISREIEAGIKRGQFSEGKFPSARDIAGTHAVSLVTAARALRVLRDKGLLRTVNRSGNFLTPSQTSVPPTGKHWGLCLRITPGPWQVASQLVIRNGFEAMARREGLTLATDLFGDLDSTDPREWRRQVALAAKKVGGIFFLPSRLSDETAHTDQVLIDACRAEGLPFVMVERNVRGWNRDLACDLVAMDDLEGGVRSTQHLLDQGCRRVAFVIGSPTSSHEARLAVYLTALFRHGGADDRRPEPIVIDQPPGPPSKETYRAIADRLIDAKADAAVCYQDYTAIGLIVELLTRGVKVPHDVAITGFDDMPIGTHFALGVTTYAFPSERVAYEALALIRRRVDNPSFTPIKVLIPGDLIVRDSSRIVAES